MTNPKLDQGPDYERGFIDGMQEQMRRSVKKMVEGKDFTISKPWVSLTEEEINEVLGADIRDEPNGMLEFVRAIESKLKQKNS